MAFFVGNVLASEQGVRHEVREMLSKFLGPSYTQGAEVDQPTQVELASLLWSCYLYDGLAEEYQLIVT